MKTGIITPVPDLSRFVTTDLTYHLILVHLFDHPEWGEEYKTFYKERSKSGDFVTLDNGAKELGSGLPVERLIDRGMEVGASELVVPDVRFECIRTLSSGRAALKWLRTQGKSRYEWAGKPKLMIVPQGKNLEEWTFCLDELLGWAKTAMVKLQGPPPTVGVGYHYDHFFEQTPFHHLLETAVKRVRSEDVHLLGWTRRLETMAEIADRFPGIRSVDSSRPLVYAKSGLRCESGNYPFRDEGFFFESLPEEVESIARTNIALFRELAHDGLYA